MWSKLKNIIIFTQLFGMQIFFSLLMICDIEYFGKEENNYYIMYIVILAVSSLIVSFTGILNKATDKKSLFFLIFPFLIFFIYFLNDKSAEGQKTFLLFLTVSFPSIYAAIYIFKNNLLKKFAILLELLMLFISVAVFMRVFLPMLHGSSFVSTVSANYQIVSYYSSLAFSLNLALLFFEKDFQLLKIRKSKLYQYFLIFLLFVQFFGVFFAGGRGAAIVVIAAILVLSYFKLQRSEKKVNYPKLFLFTGIFILISSLVMNYLYNSIEAFQMGFDRVFSYISTSGIDVTKTSNREYVYQDALDLIALKPFFGYGMFGYFAKMTYPHNLFLELLLMGGAFLLIFGVSVLIYVFIKYKKMVKLDPINLLIAPFIIYSFIMLMFSGTFLNLPIFWFAIVYTIIYSFDKTKQQLLEA